MRGPTTSTLFTDVTVIDGTGARPVERGWIRVDGDRIGGLGAGEAPAANGATVVSLRGRTILPGLTDMHVHLRSVRQAKWMLKLCLAHGVTTIKETGNQFGDLAAIGRWIIEDPVQPRIFRSGPIINGSEPELRFLPAGERTRRTLEDVLAFGVDFLKIHNWISSAAFEQIVEFSRLHDKPLTGHVPLSMTSVAAIQGGMSILEHVRLQPSEIHDDPRLVAGYPLDLVVMRRTGHWSRFDPRSAAVRHTLDAWEARRDAFFLDPTLVVQEAVAFGDAADHPGRPPVDLLSPADRERMVRAAKQLGDLTPEESERAKGSVEGMRTFVSLARERGVRLLTGTDAAVPWVVPGASLLRELELLVAAGLTPVEAIHASTGQAAAALRQADRGVLRTGAIADLVIVNGDVAGDISRIREIEQVVLSGVVHERSALLAAAAELAAADLPEPARG